MKTRKVAGRGGRGANGGTVLLLLLSLASACNSGESRLSRSVATADSSVSRPAPALVLTAPGGAEVWFGDARESSDSAGTPCTERILEIRDPRGRRVVPLLYTMDTPTVLDDSTIRARLYTDCRPGPAYRVNLRTGLPTRKEP